ncbi:phosphomethylpyrimidine synthase ThiC, partial [Streptomyces sp. NPDC005534]
MTNKDVRTPASSQTDGTSSPSENDEDGKSIGWHKAYVGGTRPDLRVPIRQVHLTNGQSVTLYDTSGPYTDPSIDTDVRRGLAPLR